MDRINSIIQNRRKFLSTLIRSGIFASLTITSAMLIRRRSQETTCQQPFVCSNCDISNRCQLPEADQYRLEKARLGKTNSEHGRTGK